MRTGLLFYSLVTAIGIASTASALPMPLRAGDILVAAHGTGNLIRVDPISGAQDVFASLPDPTDVAVSDSGDVYVTNQFAGVWQVDPSNGATTLIAPGLDDPPDGFQPVFIAANPSDDIFVLDNQPVSVVRVDPANGDLALVTSGGFIAQTANSLAVDALGDVFVSVSEVSPNHTLIFEVDPISGEQNVVYTGAFSNANDMVFDANGDLVVVTGSSVGRVDLDSGVATELSQDQLLSRPDFLDLNHHGYIFVSDLNTNSIVRIDPVTGAQTLISSGGLLVGNLGIAVFVPEPSTALLLGSGLVGLALRRRQRQRG